MYRILWVGEYHRLSTGYGTYARELLSRLYNIPNVQIAEIACVARHEEIQPSPWKIYPANPPANDARLNDIWQSSVSNRFGAMVFTDALLDFKPTHVCDIRDPWYMEYQFRHEYRDFFAHVIMPAVDASPQHHSWLDMFSKADGILSYSDWGYNVLNQYGLPNLYGTASPVAPNSIQQVSSEQKTKMKQGLGLGDAKIIGTVMRNQPRKLYPNLFKAFKKLLEQSRENIYLLCHTSFPDSWNFGPMLQELGLTNKVLFSNLCINCRSIDISFFNDSLKICPKCNTNKRTVILPNMHYGYTEPELSYIYNLMDVYVQYASNEGFGMPVAEAVMAGVPTMVVDYSATKDFINKAFSYPIKVAGYYKEPESGREFAIPDDDSFINGITSILSNKYPINTDLAKMIIGGGGYNLVANKWMSVIENTRPKYDWNMPKRLYRINTQVPDNLNNKEFARYLITHVLQEPQYIGSYLEARLIRDLERERCNKLSGGFYYHEDCHKSGATDVFNRDIALKHFVSIMQNKQILEQRRCQ